MSTPPNPADHRTRRKHRAGDFYVGLNGEADLVSRKATAIADAIIAIGFLAIAAILSVISHDESTAVYSVLIGSAMLALSFAVYANQRLLVYVIAVPLLILLCLMSLLLLFAPLAWGRSNELDAYLLQGLVALMAVLQVASVVVVRKREQ